jgi:hypothetical protein
MRVLEAKGGTITLSAKHNGELENFVKIIPLPCDTRQWSQMKGYERKYFSDEPVQSEK